MDPAVKDDFGNVGITSFVSDMLYHAQLAIFLSQVLDPVTKALPVVRVACKMADPFCIAVQQVDDDDPRRADFFETSRVKKAGLISRSTKFARERSDLHILFACPAVSKRHTIVLNHGFAQAELAL
ncbi:hypothetical protein [Ruegeria atlantica]|uniref:hypothetical protein n=1 Tax=Ruegeria atlantica TaxID=81569 RepID=UPI00147F4611|nr:hypothetical protein [Ruegeria atlantica]